MTKQTAITATVSTMTILMDRCHKAGLTPEETVKAIKLGLENNSIDDLIESVVKWIKENK